MAFQSKIKPSMLAEMDFKTYSAQLKKEFTKAAQFGKTAVVAFTNYKFSCGYEGTLLLLGKFSGELAKFYKKSKIDRKKEKDFAKGICYFETDDRGEVKVHIALNDGKGKPDKLKKNGKALFKKLGLTPEVIKGELNLDNEEGLAETEIQQIEETVDEDNDNQTIRKVFNLYKQAYKALSQQIVPIFKAKEFELIQDSHWAVARKAFAASTSFLDKYEEVAEKHQVRFAEELAIVQSKHEQLQKIAAKVKRTLADRAQVHGDSQEVEDILEDVQSVVADMRKKFQHAFSLIENLKK